jgi:Tfp pilus assembly ATPase PilU
MSKKHGRISARDVILNTGSQAEIAFISALKKIEQWISFSFSNGEKRLDQHCYIASSHPV